MATKNGKIIAVTGATGYQGGSTVRFLLEDGSFIVRGITRNMESPSAKADLDDPQSLVTAFTGVYGVFGLTNYWECVDGDRERIQGKALVDAAIKAGVQHFVWSSLDHTEYRGAHWESKADVNDYLRASGLPSTSLFTSYYFENYTRQLPLIKNFDGTFTFPVELTPDIPIAVYSAAETGAWVLAAFKNPEQWIGKEMRVASEFISARDMVKVITEYSGKTIRLSETLIDLSPPDPAQLETQTHLQRK
ncbi:NAD(P)-binding protein [Ramaria rubella]|nr:NAD(P)-binding protein [Ramaria rubella]